MPKIPSIIGKILYGGVFIAAVPVLLVFWARATEKCVTLPPIESLPAGVMIGVLGAAIMLAGMWAIYFYGHGLPMNAYPPSRFVTEGVFRLFPHPIYTGFSLLCFGIAVAAGSSSGFWLVSPAIVLGCVALVQGYEKRTTSEHFGTADTRHLIRLPPDELTPPTIAGRISAYLLCILPWLLFVQVTSLMAPTLRTSSITVEHVPVVFDRGGYRGAAQTLAPGRYDLRRLALDNDSISSVWVPPGWKVTLYEHDWFGGASKVLLGNAASLGDFNNRMSSLIVERVPSFYELPEYGGRWQSFDAGRYQAHQLVFGNDNLSSLRVPPGWMVTLYEHGDFNGETLIVTADMPVLGHWDNRVSSLVVKNALG